MMLQWCSLGGWLAGLLYDYFGFYAPVFAAGIGANILHILVVGILVGAPAPECSLRVACRDGRRATGYQETM